MFTSIDDVIARMAKQGYFPDRESATAVYLSTRLAKPLLLEGEPGVGKSELASTLAAALGQRLLVLSCHEDLTEQDAVYEWNHAKQLLRLNRATAAGERAGHLDRELFSEAYLLERPLLQALSAIPPDRPVLLIDEVERTTPELESFLAEVLGSYEVTIPELGPVRAKQPPFVVVTSNRTRPVSEALKRRCLYLWMTYPSFEREYEILTTKLPALSRALAGQLCNFMQRLRREEFDRRPGVGETIDWAQALVALRRDALDPDIVDQTLGCILKSPEDIQRFRAKKLARLLAPGVDRTG